MSLVLVREVEVDKILTVYRYKRLLAILLIEH